MKFILQDIRKISALLQEFAIFLHFYINATKKLCEKWLIGKSMLLFFNEVGNLTAVPKVSHSFRE